MTVAAMAARVAAVLPENVLDDFLATLVLEVHVDIGRLVAFVAQEALEQYADVLRVDLGDPQRITDDGVRGRAAALAQDGLFLRAIIGQFRARPLGDLVHRQEEMFVTLALDQRQLLLDGGAYRSGHAVAASVAGCRSPSELRRCSVAVSPGWTTSLG